MQVSGFIVAFGLVLVASSSSDKIKDPQKMRKFMSKFNGELLDSYYKLNVGQWNFFTNLTNENGKKSQEATISHTLLWKKYNSQVSQYAWENCEDKALKRQFAFLNQTGLAILDKDSLTELNALESDMQMMYSKGKVCGLGKKCLNLDPGLTELLANNRDYDTLKKAWVGWRDASGKKMKGKFESLVKLLNKAATMNGFNDEGDRWRKLYETKTFREDVAGLYETVKPLYQHLHAYVKRRLAKVYKNNQFPVSGHIPAHLFGNMWSQAWNNIEVLVKPYNYAKPLEITSTMVKNGYTAKKMFKTAENFFTSLGLPEMVPTFWNYSMFVRPNDRKVVCHASAWDFYTHNDFRIKMCTKVVFEDLVTIHHEMGHIQYYMNYKNQPPLFRDGANNGFHEAIGDVMALSASTPGHLKKIGLLNEVEQSHEYNINFLMSMALDKVAFLPFGYMIDSWRWAVFDGSVKPANYTRHWWELRCKLQGINPPVARAESDFDPGAKYHVAGNVAYIRYFVADIIEFQFLDALCKESGHTGKLHECDIYKSKKAGKKLMSMLSMGASKPWPEAMKEITGSERMSADSIMRYFAPLLEWLKEQNKGHDVEWTEECPAGSFVDESPSSAGGLIGSVTMVAMATALFFLM